MGVGASVTVEVIVSASGVQVGALVRLGVPSGSVVVGVSVIVEVILFGSNVQVGALVRLG
jgi:hypothetical protein